MKCEMNPKYIHYVWLGNKDKPEYVKKNIENWKEKLPDYEIKEWNEDNFDINIMNYTKQAYACGKYAYVSDVIRLFALYHYGGVYLDTDVEIVGDLDKLVSKSEFMGFESDTRLSTAVIGARPGSNWIKELIAQYQQESFIDNNGKPIMWTNVERITNYMQENKNLILNGKDQCIDEINFYHQRILSPIDMETGKNYADKTTVTIHYFRGSWITPRNRINKKIYRFIRKIFFINK